MVSDFNKKGNNEFFNKDLLLKVLAIFFLFAVVFLVVTDFRIYKEKQGMSSQIITYQKQIQDLKKSSQNLENEIANSDNQYYLEKIAYEQLGYAKSGETVYSFMSPKQNVKLAAKEKNPFDIGARLSDAWGWIKSKF